jgi:hypothetical protein
MLGPCRGGVMRPCISPIEDHQCMSGSPHTKNFESNTANMHSLNSWSKEDGG